MPPRAFAFLAGLALLAVGPGCRSSCGDRCSDRPFALTSKGKSGPDCRLVGSGGRPGLTEGCFDAVTGQPVPCPPMTGVLPGGTAPPPGAPRTDELLPFPAETTIPRPNVPFAPPAAAPGEGASRDKAPAGKTTGRP